MGVTYQGSCLCGEVSFEAGGFSTQAAACHCTMCRKFHGAPMAVLVAVDDFRYLSRGAQINEYTADNGTVRSFCSRCGSSLGESA